MLSPHDAPSPRALSTAWLAWAAEAGAFCIGAAALAGYWRHNLALVRVPTGHGTEIVINTAVGLMVGALALVWARTWPRWSAGLGACLAVGAGGVLVENLLRVNLGLDEYSLHLWLGPPNYNPGRMAVNTSLVFVCLGLVLWRLPRGARWGNGAAIRALTWTALLVSGAGVAGFATRFDALFAWNSITRMAPMTGLGLFLLSLALWAQWRNADWARAPAAVPKVQTIVSFATAALAGMAIVGGCSGFYLLHGVLERDTIAHLRQQLADRTLFIAARLQERGQFAQAVAAEPELRSAMRAGPAAVEQWSRDTLALGFTAIAVTGARGGTLGEAAAFPSPQLAVGLAGLDQDRLVWDGHYQLESDVAIGGDQLRVEQPLPELDQLTAAESDFGATGRFELCARAAADVQCFPSRFHPRPFREVAPDDGVARPMPAALAGAEGAMESVDQQSQRIIAAFAPVDGTGLGAEMVMSMAEFYGPIRTQFWIMLPLLALLTLAGIITLQRRVRPLIEDMLQAQRRAWELARNDHLTGLLNRASFLERLATALETATASPDAGVMGLLYLDLDRLKYINDTLGHAAGDRMICEFAHRLRAAVRTTDAVARLGGDEFTVLLEHLESEADAERIAHAILGSLAAPMQLLGRDVNISASIGVACHGAGALSPDDLLHQADLALYRAKQGGRGRSMIYSAAAHA